MPGKTKTYLSVIGAVIVWIAVLTEYFLIFGLMDASDTEITIRFFSFFTIWTNILIAIYFTVIGLKRDSKLQQFFKKTGVLTATAVYITLVGSIYHILLTSVWTPQGLAKVVNELLHTIIPIYVVVFWVLHEKKQGLKWKQITRWLIFPLSYLFIVMIRGYFIGWYPYPFFDLNKLSFAHLTINIVALLAYFIFLAALFVGIAKLQVNRKKIVR